MEPWTEELRLAVGGIAQPDGDARVPNNAAETSEQCQDCEGVCQHMVGRMLAPTLEFPGMVPGSMASHRKRRSTKVVVEIGGSSPEKNDTLPILEDILCETVTADTMLMRYYDIEEHELYFTVQPPNGL